MQLQSVSFSLSSSFVMGGLQSNKLNLLNLDRFGFVVTNSSEFQLLKVARRHALVSVYCFCNKLYKCKKLLIFI